MESEEILQKQFLVAYENCSSAGSHSLLRALKRFITSKPRYERRAPEFVREVRNKLYYVHQYNCHVAELTEKYPRSRHLDFLLMRYVQLEFDSLYRLNNDCPVDRSSEQEVEERILKLLQIVLQAAIVKNDCAGAIFKSKDMDVVLRKSIIKLLFNLKPRYLERRKLVYNLIRHLLEKIDRIKNEEYVQNIDKYLSIFTLDDPPQNFTVSGVAVTTSDYGTEEDSHSSSLDSDDSSYNLEAFNRQQHFDVFLNLNFDAAGGGGDDGPPAQCTNRSTSDSRIVPSAITDKSATGNSSLESPTPKNNHTNSNDSNSNINNKNNHDDGGNKNKHPRLSQKQNTSVEPALKSDKKRTLGRKALVNRPNKKSRTAPSGGVVTFEILDSDSEDEGCSSPKFMLSLQEEVKSNTGRKSKRIKREVSTIIIDDPSDVVIAHNCIHNDSLSITDEIKEEMSNCSQQSMPVVAHEIIDLSSSSSSDSESDEDIDSVQRQEFEPPPSISSNSLRSEVQSEVEKTEEITVKTEGENNREEITSSDARNDSLSTILENEVEMRSASDSVKEEEEEEEGEIEKERTTASDALNDVLPTNLEGNVGRGSASGCVKEEAVSSPPPMSSNGMNSEEPQGNLLDLLLGDGRMPQGLNRKVYSRKPDSAKKRRNDSVSDVKSAQTVGVMNTDASSTKGLHCVDIANLMEPPPQQSSLDLDLIPGDTENNSGVGDPFLTQDDPSNAICPGESLTPSESFLDAINLDEISSFFDEMSPTYIREIPVFDSSASFEWDAIFNSIGSGSSEHENSEILFEDKKDNNQRRPCVTFEQTPKGGAVTPARRKSDSRLFDDLFDSFYSESS